MNHCTQYTTANLILLMGMNPLPNYIAARMLGWPSIRLHLVITPEIGTTKLAERLILTLGGNPKDESQYLYLNSSDPSHIFQQISTRVKNTSGRWGLHYTGGKKVMVIQAFKAMEKALADSSRPDGIYSYLDADRNALVIDPFGTGHGDICPIEENVSLRQLLQLHGQPDRVTEKVNWGENQQENSDLNKKPRRVPFQSEFCSGFLSAWLEQPDEMAAWRAMELGVSSGRLCKDIYAKKEQENVIVKELAGRGMILGIGYDASGKKATNSRVKKELQQLRQEIWEHLSFPEIARKKAGVDNLKTMSVVANVSIATLGDWLEGKWLEDYVLAQVIAIATDCGINDYALGLESNLFNPENEANDKFESDVIFMRGHQLFYISVTTDTTKHLNKNKLFEAYHRAQQLGGEHAQAGLVTLYPNPRQLEKELLSERHALVCAFGPNNLRTPQIFRSELKVWMEGIRKPR